VSEPSGPPPSKFPSGVPSAFGSTAPETIERFGRPTRHYQVAVSVEAMALAWANQEDGPHGATVTVEHEIGARGFHGAVWTVPAADTLACAVVLRPPLPVEEADVTWLAAGLIALEGSEALSDRELSLWWPDKVISGPDRELMASVKVEVQLGPGRVKNVVASMRFDLAKLGLGGARREELLEAVVNAVDHVSERVDEGAAAVAAGYESRCALVGQRIKAKLRPKGETRGTVRSIDRSARLELASPSGMIERVGIDQIMTFEAV